MDEQIWSFSRNGELLEIKRAPTDDGFLLSVTGDGPPRTYAFTELNRLEQFQADFEKFLLGTGWTFKAFSPDRRTGRERRHFSRLLSDRRRWWTDSLRPAVAATTATPTDSGLMDDDRERRLRRLHRRQR